jgi:RNA recognition motif-containing protein
MDQNKLYVGNLPWSVTSDVLRDVFSEFGEVVDAVVISDRMSGRSKGFGFVTFADSAAAQAAIEKMHDSDMEGRKLVVNIARPKEERPVGGGGYRSRNGGGDGYRRGGGGGY